MASGTTTATRGEHIVLVGAMGSGKTTVGRILAALLSRPLLDSDEQLRSIFGLDARELLRTEGRDRLHDEERRVLRLALSDAVPSIVTAAAGDVDEAAARESIRAAGYVVYLRASEETLVRRIGDGSTRPIEGDVRATVARLEGARGPRYEALADVVVDVDEASADVAADAVLTGLSRRVQVPLGARSYEVVIGPGTVRGLRTLLPSSARRAAIVTQAGIGVEVDPGITAETFLIGDGEGAKSLATIEELCRAFSRFGLTRSDVVVAVGGGVVTDAAGFAAACYHRGTAVVNVATTLLGQIDAAVGGKTAVNIPEGKNLIGAFWQPAAVVCDTETLKTVPERERRSGFGEMAKYAFLGVEDLDRLQLVEQVAACVAMKASVVAEDEREGDRRLILNYGHTLAHALEAAGFADGPGRGGVDLRHGEAVAIGLVFAARLARLLGRIDDARVTRHLELVRTYGLPSEIPPGVDLDEILTVMARDKKATAGLTFVLDGPLGVEPVRDIARETILDALVATTSGGIDLAQPAQK